MSGAHEARLEIAHVLFIDIVGYSKLPINQQSELLRLLNQIVRSTEQFRLAERANTFVRLPTGDGMALVFFTSPDAPVKCAIEIARALKESPQLKVRMGIHSGPVDAVDDVNDRRNVAGAGINLAQRVMDCGDGGHILLSKRVADDLGQYEYWQPYLYDLGESEVKHGVKVEVVSFYDGEVGNPELPTKLARSRQEHEVLASRAAVRRRRKIIVLAGLGALLLAVALGAAWWGLRRPGEVLAVPEASVAVLPFENLSPDPANAYLAGGLQDEVITQLSKIGGLKVISRTSTMQYGSKPANLRQIAKELGVAAILEGSVEKVGDQIHVNVQLIRAATDAHLWADSYTRELIDLLSAQSEIAQRIAAELNTKLTAEEKARIEEKTTKNPEAYALYLKGTEVLRRPAVSAARMEEGQHYFEQAIALDPNFALAHARLGLLHSRIAAFFDPSAVHKQNGRAEAEEALRLQPQLSEGHVALGFFFGRVSREYETALKEYEMARQGAPNDPYILYGIANVQMRRGQYRAAIASFERATSLDPMNWLLFDNLGNAYGAVGMLAAAERAKRRAMELASGDPMEKFNEEYSWGWAFYGLAGSTEKLDESLARHQSTDDPNGVIALFTYMVRMVERDYDRAQRIIENSPTAIFETFTGPRATKKFLLGTVALARGNVEKARPLFEAELPFARSEVAESPESAVRHAQLGLICAYLGRKEEAIAEGQRAVELLPISKDAFDGPFIALSLAEIYGRVGEEEQAMTLLEKLMTTPNGATQLLLKDWNWDPLRKNSRFQKLVNGPPPKIIYE